MIIAIDGPAAAGKGTLARRLAEALGLAYLDTGSLYRAVGLIMVEAGQKPEDESAAAEAAKELSFDKLKELSNSPDLRSEGVGIAASKVSAIPGVREALLNFQRDFADNPPQIVGEQGATPAKGAVLDGRDIGTVICPDAEIKLFVTASAEKRAERRYKELQEKENNVIYDRILQDIKDRDERDRNRTVAPLRPADDAIIVDTSDMNAEEVFDFVAKKLGR
ncbi:MAG: (d)CMP kinase [Alphaproteobacteria bacterium]|nr:(d)CMP kinase [Alphaproteobacteria bacterium]